MTESSMDPGISAGQCDRPCLVLKPGPCKGCVWAVTREATFNSEISMVNTHMDTDGMENSTSLKQNLNQCLWI